jgi:flagellar hook-basal body complex protein FliE
MAMNPIVSIQDFSRISGIKPIREGFSETTPLPAEGSVRDFKTVFNSLIDNVETTEAIAEEDSYKLSIGQVDDLHTMMINSARAEIALQTMVQLRNKVLDAYTEIMRINL